MDVTAQVQQVGRLRKYLYFIIILEECAGMLITLVIRFGIAIENALWQKSGSLIALLPDKEMVMVWHEAIGDDV